MSAPELPTWQDCHELWSKKRRRQLREQQEAMQNLPPGKPPVLAKDGKPFGLKPEEGSEVGGSSKILKMEAYDTAVLSYALATAAGKLKPGLLGIAPNLNAISQINPAAAQRLEDVSLTPPRPDIALQEREDTQSNLFQLLTNVEQALLNKTSIQLHQLLALCSSNKQQLDSQGAALMESLQNEMRQVCKTQPSLVHQLDLGEDDLSKPAGSLKTEAVCVALAELLRYYGFNEGANLLWAQFF